MSVLKDVFISYGRDSGVSQFVNQLRKDLETSGISVWMDIEDIPIGTDWRAEITTGVENCRFFVPVITQKYVSSRYCVSELYAADNNQKKIFPVIFSDTDFSLSDSAKGVTFVIGSINWTMLRPGIDDYGQSLEKLICAIKKIKDFAESQSIGLSSGMLSPVSASDAASSVVIPRSKKPTHKILGLNYPNGIAVSNDNKILITMMESSEIWMFDNSYQKIRTIGGPGVEKGQFYTPFGVVVDNDNNVIVSCGALECIQKFNLQGEYLKGAGKPGKGEFDFQAPNGLAVNKDGLIYICDVGNNRIQILSKEMEFLGSFRHADQEYGSGSLNQPNGIAINSEGNVFVADMLNHCIQVFSPHGKFLTRIGKQGHIGGCLISPMSITIDEKDNVYVGDGIGRVATFTKTGAFLRQFGESGMDLGMFGLIRGICIDTDRRLYVCEWQTNRVQVFQ